MRKAWLTQTGTHSCKIKSHTQNSLYEFHRRSLEPLPDTRVLTPPRQGLMDPVPSSIPTAVIPVRNPHSPPQEEVSLPGKAGGASCFKTQVQRRVDSVIFLISSFQTPARKQTSPCLEQLSVSPAAAHSLGSWTCCDVDHCPPEGPEVHSLAALGPHFLSAEASGLCCFFSSL